MHQDSTVHGLSSQKVEFRIFYRLEELLLQGLRSKDGVEQEVFKFLFPFLCITCMFSDSLTVLLQANSKGIIQTFY